ncbi:MAG: hybrid sensor histidine kinase/response regulator [Chloroflexi bacterium]|nr:hybrid sensor histidine kinase/response regulator [Chloroflexota bacterium]
MPPDLILFVEDNADFRDSAARFLELNGFEVIVSGDGIEALELLKQTTRIPDVIVSDISMPRMNGYEFFEAVRNQPHLKGIPFIFLTALDARADIRLGWEVGVDEYLVKPFRPEDFLSVIRNRLKRTRELKSLAERQLQETRNMIVRILSHELRTPLTYVTGGFTLLADEINKQEQGAVSVDRKDVQTILDLIYNGTNRLNRLAEQMVMLAELTSTQSGQSWEHMTERLNLAEVIDAAASSMIPVAREHSVTLEYGDLSALIAEGIQTLLIPAVTEPVRNAIQYSEPGSTVQVTCYPDTEHPGMAVIEIRDNGRGISESDLETIWELMSQSEREKFEQQGFGLGLPITQKIMQLHQGYAEIHSKMNEGTVILLRLPLATEPIRASNGEPDNGKVTSNPAPEDG